MPIKIITIGKKHEAWIALGVERYSKRLKQPFSIEWVFLPNSPLKGSIARQNESKAIFSRLNTNDYVILLDEQGKNINSIEFSNMISKQFESSRQIVLIIGGAYGVDDTLHQRAGFIWSLSNLVFPHQLVRLILTEQLYRAQEIFLGNPYHHE